MMLLPALLHVLSCPFQRAAWSTSNARAARLDPGSLRPPALWWEQCSPLFLQLQPKQSCSGRGHGHIISNCQWVLYPWARWRRPTCYQLLAKGRQEEKIIKSEPCFYLLKPPKFIWNLTDHFQLPPNSSILSNTSFLYWCDCRCPATVVGCVLFCAAHAQQYI